MPLHLILALLLVACKTHGRSVFEEMEPGTILSRFDYDYEMLKKVIALESKIIELERRLGEEARRDFVSGKCLNGWTHYERSCYYFGHTDLEFVAAEKFCTHYHAHLVTIDTEEENNFIRNFLSGLKDHNYWMGLSDEIVEGEWRWQSNGAVAIFVDWYPGEPNLKTANCGAFWDHVDYHWIDELCTHKYKPLCEMQYEGK